MQRINRRVDADFNIRAPQPGSWVLDVLAGAAPIVGAAPAASALLEVPLKVLTAWVIKKLTGGNANQVEAILKLEQERTKQSRQETRRLELQGQARQTGPAEALDTGGFVGGPSLEDRHRPQIPLQKVIDRQGPKRAGVNQCFAPVHSCFNRARPCAGIGLQNKCSREGRLPLPPDLYLPLAFTFTESRHRSSPTVTPV